jgi:hypothetical protein
MAEMDNRLSRSSEGVRDFSWYPQPFGMLQIRFTGSQLAGGLVMLDVGVSVFELFVRRPPSCLPPSCCGSLLS